MERLRPVLRETAVEDSPEGSGLICNRYEVSPRHLRRQFAETMGEPIGAYARRTALELAAIRLCNSLDTIWSIGLDSGYGTPDGFIRAFRCHFGCTPARFRALNFGCSPAFPSYYLTDGRALEWTDPCEIGVYTAAGELTSFVYDGPRLVDRIEPPSHADPDTDPSLENKSTGLERRIP